jgi:hypothetical protein
MATDDPIQAAAQAFGSMTDDEATAWIAAGDYTSVAGIPLPEVATSKFAQLAAGDEVEGFSFDLNLFSPQQIQLPEADTASKGSPSLAKYCCTGAHLKKAVLTC